MTFYWPRPSPDLPPGQRLLPEMPRFTDRPFQSPPPADVDVCLAISIERKAIAELTTADLDRLDPTDYRADFHCVTTWSVKDLTWTGVPLSRVMESIGLSLAAGPFLVAKAADRRRGHFVSADAFADDVILATRLDGQPLGERHGGPLRLVAPQHYGYKSIKHLVGLDFRADEPPRLGKEHLRGRVAFQERHPTLPSWLVKHPYRLLIPPTAHFAERSLS